MEYPGYIPWLCHPLISMLDLIQWICCVIKDVNYKMVHVWCCYTLLYAVHIVKNWLLLTRVGAKVRTGSCEPLPRSCPSPPIKNVVPKKFRSTNILGPKKFSVPQILVKNILAKKLWAEIFLIFVFYFYFPILNAYVLCIYIKKMAASIKKL